MLRIVLAGVMLLLILGSIITAMVVAFPWGAINELLGPMFNLWDSLLLA